MKLTTTKNGSALLVCIEDRLDTTTAPEMEKALEPEMTGITELTLDLEKLTYISSAGLRVLLSLHKMMAKKGGMKVTHANEDVMEIFDVTGFTDILNIE